MQPENQIPNALRDLIDRELASGEHVQWMQMPVPRYFTPRATAAFLAGIPCTAFALFWTATAAWGTSRGGDAGLLRVFPLFGVPFILIGLALLSGPFWAHRKALKSVYVITNRRAITFDGGWSMTVRSYPPERLTEVFRKEKKDGIGDVVITHRAWRDSDGYRHTEELGFLNVREPKVVESMLNTLAGQARVREAGADHIGTGSDSPYR